MFADKKPQVAYVCRTQQPTDYWYWDSGPPTAAAVPFQVIVHCAFVSDKAPMDKHVY